MRYLFSSLAVLYLCTGIAGQDFAADFTVSQESGDTARQLQILGKWEIDNPRDPALFVAYFNYYVNTARKEVLSMSAENPGGESIMLQDSMGKTAGFIESRIIYDEKLLEQGLNKIEEGIKRYPDRLDMRFGKIFALGEAGYWGKFKDEIVRAIRQSNKIDNIWRWDTNEPLESGAEIFLSSLQDYQGALFNTGDPALLPHIRTIAQKVLAYHPDHIESLSNLSVTYLLAGEYDKGIVPLLKAEKLDPQDAIVLGNIAYGYIQMGEKSKAIEYYKKVIDHGDDESIAFAREQIAALE
ncbi:tetratricopeptide repeat protein [Lewinella sp. IMCC34191]|uniref:tetratricopeptide repeat protein n=1 Tax=Lewinella sp. IMCC34191 TaxID=2259172 RepID=UPI000E26AB3E|nr:tetratricopeptide repeat protein [Lewinella sp. IMCC34191]